MSGELQLTVASDAGKGPSGEVKRWLMELKLADKREKDWRREGNDIYRRYRGEGTKKNSFNILWANTEITAPAIFSSAPKVDVRRRWRDEDALGKAMAEVLERATEYSVDSQDFEHQMRQCVLDMLLPGRGVVRERYVPSFAQVAARSTPPTGLPEPGNAAAPHDESAEEPTHEANEGRDEELAWEQSVTEWVRWDDFRCSAGAWEDKCWIAFRHKLTREQLVEKFGELGSRVQLDQSPTDEEIKKLEENEQELFKRAVVWEIWDKDRREVLFINESVKDQPLLREPDPLRLLNFFPVPRPLRAIDDPDNDVPIPLFRQYKEQADELDRISTRINKLIDALKFRGVYDSTITEIGNVMKSNDNQLIPAQNVRALIERGGLEKAIWFLPIQTAAQVLVELYKQREACKQVIYELTGLADIMRGSSSANETATAQRIKEQFGSMRLKRMQKDCARFIRDIICLKAEIIAEHFTVDTLKQQTGLKYPMQAEKMQAMQMAQQAQMAGQPVPEQVQAALSKPSWEEIAQAIKDDAQRLYRVDIETDSTIAETITRDQKDIADLLAGVTQFIAGVGPAVESGALPVDAAKSMLMTAVRHARMGRDVEDALEKIQQPQQKPEQQQAPDRSVEVEQIKQQGEAQRLQHEAQLKAAEAQAQAQVEQMRVQNEQQLKQMQISFDEWKAKLESETRITVAEIAAGARYEQQERREDQAET